MAKTVIFDFDAVINSYKSGWIKADIIPDPPVEGIKDEIHKLRTRGYKVVVVSTRCYQEGGIDAIERYLNKYDILVDDVTGEKPPAIVTVDDRAICFDGNAKGLAEKVMSFKNWIERSK